MYGACLYGTVDISFSTSFIYDRELLNAGGSYRWDHADRAVQRSGALSAVFHDSTQIPPSGAQETLSYAIHYQNRPGSSRINVQQSSFVDDTYSNELYPQGRIAFLSDDLTTGDRLPIMLPGSNQDDGVLVYFVTVGLTESCVHAFAYGEWLDITLAANTTADEGGQLAFSATDVPVYHPTATPLGDITQGVADAAGLAVCPSGS
jgi:hypothetical protein